MYELSGFAEKLNIQNFVNSAGIVYIIYVRNVWICRKIEYPELREFNGKLCSLNVRTVWICRQIENPELRKFKWKLCTLNVRKVWFCREIEYPKFRKFSAKLCTLYLDGMSGFEEKLNIQNSVYSTGNCVH